MGPNSAAYLFFEFGLLFYLLGFCYGKSRLKYLKRKTTWIGTILLMCIWFTADQLALKFDIWDFPRDGGTLPIRIFSLPVEEYLLFIIHPVICLVLMGNQEKPQ